MRTFPHKYKHIVLVDDDSDDRDLFAEALTYVDPDIKLDTKRDGEELMDYLNAHNPPVDVIFLDLNMPRKNGKECLVEVRANEAYQHVPVVVYTTSLNPVDIDETFRRGANFFLRKPNSFEELKETLNNMLHATLQLRDERTKDNFVVKPSFKLV